MLIACTRVWLVTSPLLLARACATASQPDDSAFRRGQVAPWRFTAPVKNADKLLTAAGLMPLTISKLFTCGRPAKAPMALESKSFRVHPDPSSLAFKASSNFGCNLAPNVSPHTFDDWRTIAVDVSHLLRILEHLLQAFEANFSGSQREASKIQRNFAVNSPFRWQFWGHLCPFCPFLGRLSSFPSFPQSLEAGRVKIQQSLIGRTQIFIQGTWPCPAEGTELCAGLQLATGQQTCRKWWRGHLLLCGNIQVDADAGQTCGVLLRDTMRHTCIDFHSPTLLQHEGAVPYQHWSVGSQNQRQLPKFVAVHWAACMLVVKTAQHTSQWNQDLTCGLASANQNLL